MNQQETLFLRTLLDLESRINSDDPYEILGASGLIRKLFLDDHPLVDQVNRIHKLKLTFLINESRLNIPGLPVPDFYTVQDGLDPETSSSNKNTIEVNRDRLYKTVLMVADNKQYTLREIILFEANIMGAVHAGSPRNEKEHVLQELSSTLFVGGYSSSLRQLKAIGRVILKGLTPLKNIIGKINK